MFGRLVNPVSPAAGLTSAGVIPPGVIPPVLTPLTPDRTLDLASLERLCGLHLEAGAAALFVGGSTGETAYLTDEQRAHVLRAVIGTAAGQVPVVAGVIDMTTSRVIQHARTAEKAGAAGVVATAPFYAPTHPAEMAVHFRQLAAAVDLPVLAYDIPMAVHVKLPSALVVELATDGVLAGLKDSSGDIDGFRAVTEAVDVPSFHTYTGSETHADLAMFCGADGIVPGLGNVDPVGFVRLYNAARQGDWSAATAEQDRLRRLFGIISVGDRGRMGMYSSAIGAFKEALVQRGVLASATTSLPMIPLDDGEIAAVRAYLEEAGLA